MFYAFKCPAIHPEFLALHSTSLEGSLDLIQQTPFSQVRQGGTNTISEMKIETCFSFVGTNPEAWQNLAKTHQVCAVTRTSAEGSGTVKFVYRIYNWRKSSIEDAKLRNKRYIG